MHLVHLTKPYRKNILGIMLSLGSVPFSLLQIISANEDTSILKQIE